MKIPSNTFFNLSSKKRERIIGVAIDEFALNTYSDSSVNRIVEKAEIAKGSFYQYFHDKDDLYKYILEYASEKKLKYLDKIFVKEDEIDFFQLVRELFLGGLNFARMNSGLAAIGIDFIRNRDSELKQNIINENMDRSLDIFAELLKKGVEKKELKAEIDIELLSYMISSLSIFLIEYYFKKAEKSEIKEQEEKEVMILVEKMLDIIKNGIKAQEEEDNVSTKTGL